MKTNDHQTHTPIIAQDVFHCRCNRKLSFGFRSSLEIPLGDLAPKTLDPKMSTQTFRVMIVAHGHGEVTIHTHSHLSTRRECFIEHALPKVPCSGRSRHRLAWLEGAVLHDDSGLEVNLHETIRASISGSSGLQPIKSPTCS